MVLVSPYLPQRNREGFLLQKQRGMFLWLSSRRGEGITQSVGWKEFRAWSWFAFPVFSSPLPVLHPKTGQHWGGAEPPPALPAVPGHFSAIYPRAAHGFAVLERVPPGLPPPGFGPGHGQFLYCGRGAEGEGAVTGNVLPGWPKETKKVKPIYFTMHFAISSASEHFYNSDLYYMVQKT